MISLKIEKCRHKQTMRKTINQIDTNRYQMFQLESPRHSRDPSSPSSVKG